MVLQKPEEVIERLEKKATSIGAISKKSPELIIAVFQAAEIIGGSTPKVNEDEALAMALILHIKARDAQGMKSPISEDEVIKRLAVNRKNIQLLMRGRHAEYWEL
jgi:hypothetical protein